MRHFFTDGRKFSANRVSRKASWKKDQLVIETKAGQIKIKEIYSAGPEPGQLTVQLSAKNPRFGGELDLTRVYQKVTES
jgi:hypothetical protein